jgi:hypothetical protein
MRPDPQRIRDAARVYGADELELMRIAYPLDDAKPKPKKRRPRHPNQDPNIRPL